MENRKKIIDNREEKNIFIKSLINDNNVISLKANIPGINKQIKEAYILTKYFNNILNKLGYISKYYLDGPDGPMYIYTTSKDETLKKKMESIEEQELGRFVDIDVFNDNISLNRNTLRKCYICDDPAFICSRSQKHTAEELNKYISLNIEDKFTRLVKEKCNNAIMEELNLHPKFGLVTPQSNGSHKDMDYNTMITGKEAILDSFVEMFLVGYKEESIQEIFKQIRSIGIIAEEKMMKATNNINAYKGLIFVLGLIVASVGYKLSHLDKEVNIFEVISEMTKGITNELHIGNDTYGKYAYQQYGITGVRGEAELGFPHIQYVINNNLDDIYKILFYYISNIDDTVLLKRSQSYSKYLEVKEWFKVEKDINQLTNKCIFQNLSFGGSADLLIATLFIKKFNNIIQII